MFKESVLSIIKNWIHGLDRHLHGKYATILIETSNFLADYQLRVKEPIEDLDDIQFIMETLDEIKKKTIWIEMNIIEVEV